MKKLLLAAVLAAFPLTAWSKPPAKECGPLPPAFDGVAFAGDGDTIYGVSYPAGIRLWGFNAPEVHLKERRETVPGMSARSITANLLTEAHHIAHCEPIEWDHHCRVVATCTTSQGKDLSLEVLKAGYGYGYFLAKNPALVDRAKAYDEAEYGARKAGLGLWPYWQGQKPLVETPTATH